MKTIYIITGGAGHLGSTIIRMLEKKITHEKKKIQTTESEHQQYAALKDTIEIRGLLLPGEAAPLPENVCLHWYEGDVTCPESLSALFDVPQKSRIIVIHTAGIIDITASRVTRSMYDVNVNGTKNVVMQALAHHVHRFIYVSSVHAIPELPEQKTIIETNIFHPDNVVGGYAKTKAEATRFVLESVSLGLPAIVVHPSGIIGPYDPCRNHMVALVRDYITGKLPACVRGGYDFVDVRDVAVGCLLAAEKGTIGQCYILSNAHYDVKKMLDSVGNLTNSTPVPMIPMWLAKMLLPFLGWHAKIRRQKPLYTSYSLHTLTSNGHFSHEKATRDLDYHPRALKETLKDTIRWLRIHKYVPSHPRHV